MGNYATTATNVAPLVPYRTIGASTSPSTTTVDSWIEEAEAELDGILSAQGLSVPLSGTNPIRIARGWVAEYVAGRVMRAYATAGGDPANEQGRTEIEAWRLRMKEIAMDASRFGAQLGQGTSATTLTSYAQSSGFDSSEFAPSFTRDEKF